MTSIRTVRRCGVAVLGLVAAGCTADLPTSTAHPTPGGEAVHYRTATHNGQEYLTFGTEEEAIASVGWARVNSGQPDVYWQGNTAIASSRMSYYGTHGSQLLSLAANGPNGSAVPWEWRTMSIYSPETGSSSPRA